MHVVLVAALAGLLVAAPAAAQQPALPTPAPSPQAPAPQAPAAPPSTPVASASRTFTAPVGLLFNAVRPERVADFEQVIGYLETALASSADPTVRAQAQGWRVLKASEPGPNGSVLYVFILDPVVTGADYGLGRILAAAFPDPAKLQEVWKLYTDSVASGGSLLNLSPLEETAKP